MEFEKLNVNDTIRIIFNSPDIPTLDCIYMGFDSATKMITINNLKTYTDYDFGFMLVPLNSIAIIKAKHRGK